ncbi:hypothetical protein [Paenibacillus sp. GXUN7292]|uniref:hypothetical protein n=1 Tax=Paenibacillus sp. GXUN7292 TaxID=3422499 RepID=UPI003D7D4027
MSQANIPDINPQIAIKRDDVINLFIASLAMEELGLSHIINAEAEKLQFVLGTLHNASLKPPATFKEVLETNESVRLMLREISRKEQVLNDRLELIINVSSNSNPPDPPNPPIPPDPPEPSEPFVLADEPSQLPEEKAPADTLSGHSSTITTDPADSADIDDIIIKGEIDSSEETDHL